MSSCPPSSADKAQCQTTSLMSKEVTICKSKGTWQKLRLQNNIAQQQQLVSFGNAKEGTLLSSNLYTFNPHFTLLTLNPFPTSTFTCHHPPRWHDSDQGTKALRLKERPEQQQQRVSKPQTGFLPKGQRLQVLLETSPRR